MEIKVHRTDNKAFPWRAEDDEGHYMDGRTKEAAITALKTMFYILPKVHEQQCVAIPNEVRLQ